MIKSPYNDALSRPRATEPLFFIKNDTVIGTIGNTQGVNNAAKPQRIAVMIELQSSGAAPDSFLAVSAAATGSPGITTSNVAGFAVHWLVSLVQIVALIKPVRVLPAEALIV